MEWWEHGRSRAGRIWDTLGLFPYGAPGDIVLRFFLLCWDMHRFNAFTTMMFVGF
jgi:hypothetical protein